MRCRWSCESAVWLRRFSKDVVHVVQRSHQRRVVRDVENVQPVRVRGGVHYPVQRLVICHLVRLQTEDRAHGIGNDRLSVGGCVEEPGPSTVQSGVKRGGVPVTAPPCRRKPRLRQRVRRDGAEPHLLKKQRVPFLHQPHHLADHRARFVRRVAGVHHALQTMQHDARHRVHHGRERPDGNHVTCGLDRALIGVALDLLQTLRVRVRLDVPKLPQNRDGIVFEQRRELAVAVPRTNDRALVDVERLTAEWRHERSRLLQFYVALTGLLRVVEGIGVQERPDEVTRHVLETELEVRMLIDSVVPRVERQRADRVALFLRDLCRADDPRRVTRARGGYGAVKRRRRSGSECNEGRCGDEHGARIINP